MQSTSLDQLKTIGDLMDKLDFNNGEKEINVFIIIIVIMINHSLLGKQILWSSRQSIYLWC